MLQKLKSFIDSNSLIPDGSENVLLAVSGGMDSMCMLDLFLRIGYNVAVAHCNFNLRGKESNNDEDFIRDYCKKKELKIYIENFDTELFAKENGISVQMAARDLRYKWMEEVRSEYGYDCIATAHHKDDEIETFFINLIRGTGLAGLKGIPVRNASLIRPLLFAARTDIEEYVQVNNIPFREDSSNAQTKYLRNKIRHNIIPQLISLNESFRKELYDTVSGIRSVYAFYQENVQKIIKEISYYHEDHLRISIAALQKNPYADIILFEFLKDYGFNRTAIGNILSALDNDTSGKVFYSGEYKLLKDRKYLMLTKLRDIRDEVFFISEDQGSIDHPVAINIKTLQAKDVKIQSSKKRAYIDKGKLSFPLKIRRWRKGDYFYPLGMKGKKLLSDFFIDEKISRNEKEQTWLLCSGEDIVWIIGKRINEKYKISAESGDVLLMEL